MYARMCGGHARHSTRGILSACMRVCVGHARHSTRGFCVCMYSCVLVVPDIKREDSVFKHVCVCWSCNTYSTRGFCVCACMRVLIILDIEARKFRVCACIPVCMCVLFMPDIQQEDFVFVYTSRATTNVIRHVGQMSVRKTKSLYVCTFSKNITCTKCFQKRKEFLYETDHKTPLVDNVGFHEWYEWYVRHMRFRGDTFVTNWSSQTSVYSQYQQINLCSRNTACTKCFQKRKEFLHRTGLKM